MIFDRIPSNPLGKVPAVVRQVLDAFRAQDQQLFQRLMAIRAADRTGGEYDGSTGPASGDQEEADFDGSPFIVPFEAGEWQARACWEDPPHALIAGGHFAELEVFFKTTAHGKPLEILITIYLPASDGRVGWRQEAR